MVMIVTYIHDYRSHVLKVLKQAYPPRVFFCGDVLVGVYGSVSVVQNVSQCSQTLTADYTPPVTVVVFAHDQHTSWPGRVYRNWSRSTHYGQFYVLGPLQVHARWVQLQVATGTNVCIQPVHVKWMMIWVGLMWCMHVYVWRQVCMRIMRMNALPRSIPLIFSSCRHQRKANWTAPWCCSKWLPDTTKK